MVSSTLCPAVHILGSQNVYGRAEGPGPSFNLTTHIPIPPSNLLLLTKKFVTYTYIYIQCHNGGCNDFILKALVLILILVCAAVVMYAYTL